jgi:hypothetical protein
LINTCRLGREMGIFPAWDLWGSNNRQHLMSEETIQNPQDPLTLTNETIVGQAFLPVHLARRHDPLVRPVGTYLRDVPS